MQLPAEITFINLTIGYAIEGALISVQLSAEIVIMSCAFSTLSPNSAITGYAIEGVLTYHCAFACWICPCKSYACSTLLPNSAITGYSIEGALTSVQLPAEITFISLTVVTLLKGYMSMRLPVEIALISLMLSAPFLQFLQILPWLVTLLKGNVWNL